MRNTNASHKIFGAAAVLSLTFIGMTAAQALKDHPMVPRYAGSELIEGDSWTKSFDEYPLVTGPSKGDTYPNVQHLEGRVTHRHYQNPENASTLEVYRAYASSLRQSGFKVLFACSDRECGDSVTNDGQYQRYFGYWCVASSIQCPEPMRYIAAKLSRPEGDVYVAVKIRTNIGLTLKTEGTYLNVIEIKPMEGQLSSPSFSTSPSPATSIATAPTPGPAPVVMTTLTPRPVATTESRHMVAGQEIAAGTEISIRMIDNVDSERCYLGQIFRASIDKPVTDARGDVVVNRGADVTVRLVSDKQSGKIAGRTVLTLSLETIKVDGRDIDVNSTDLVEQSGSRGKRSAKVIGGTSGAGALMGALAGGGRGALIGALSGAGAGTGVELLTKGQRVRIPAETRLVFQLQAPVKM